MNADEGTSHPRRSRTRSRTSRRAASRLATSRPPRRPPNRSAWVRSAGRRRSLAPPRRLLRPRTERVIGGVCAGLGRYFNIDPMFVRIAAMVLALLGGAGVLLYMARLLLVPAEDAAPVGEPRGRPQPRPRHGGRGGAAADRLALSSRRRASRGRDSHPLAFLVAAGVLVWWLVAGEGPSGDAGDIAKRAALGIGVLIACLVVALGGAWAAAAGGGALVGALVIGAGRRDRRGRLLQAGAVAGAAGDGARALGGDGVTRPGSTSTAAWASASIAPVR